MQAEAKYPVCRKCSQYTATKNCHACNAPLCVACVHCSVIKYDANTSLYSQNYDLEFIKRCKECDAKNALPRVQRPSNGECVLQ